MPLPRSRRRRAWLAPALGGLVALAGCQGIPLPRPNPTPAQAEPSPAPPAANPPAPIPEPLAELPPLPTTPTPRPAVPPDALRRAEELARVALDQDKEPARPSADPQLFLADVHAPDRPGPPDRPEPVPAEAPPQPAEAPESPPSSEDRPTAPEAEDPGRHRDDPPDREDAVATAEKVVEPVDPKPAAAERPAVPAKPEAKPPAEPRPDPEPTAPEPALEVAELAICRRVKGFGDVVPWGLSAPRAGQPVLIYCALGGIRFESDGSGVRSRLAATVELRDVERERPVWSRELKEAEDRRDAPRRDYYVAYRVLLPPNLPPGRYRLRLRARDLVVGREAERTIPVTVAR